MELWHVVDNEKAQPRDEAKETKEQWEPPSAEPPPAKPPPGKPNISTRATDIKVQGMPTDLMDSDPALFGNPKK